MTRKHTAHQAQLSTILIQDIFLFCNSAKFPIKIQADDWELELENSPPTTLDSFAKFQWPEFFFIFKFGTIMYFILVTSHHTPAATFVNETMQRLIFIGYHSPVNGRPISANPGLNFNSRFLYFFHPKPFPTLFGNIQQLNCKPKNFN